MPRSKKKELPPAVDPNQRWLDINQAGSYLGFCPTYVRQLIHQGELKASFFGNTYRIDRNDCDQLMLRRKRTVPPYRRGSRPWVAARHEAARKAASR